MKVVCFFVLNDTKRTFEIFVRELLVNYCCDHFLLINFLKAYSVVVWLCVGRHGAVFEDDLCKLLIF